MHWLNNSQIWISNEARAKEAYSEVKHIGIDETSKKGHNYITAVVD